MCKPVIPKDIENERQQIPLSAIFIHFLRAICQVYVLIISHYNSSFCPQVLIFRAQDLLDFNPTTRAI